MNRVKVSCHFMWCYSTQSKGLWRGIVLMLSFQVDRFMDVYKIHSRLGGFGHRSERRA